MEDTGRIRELLTPTARRIVFGVDADRAIDAELDASTEVDRAHLVMLGERALLPRETVGALLRAIAELREAGWAPLRGRSAPRGLYLLYESWLVGELGETVGGALHLGRSRNDLAATVLRLRLREPLRRLVGETLRLQAVLLAGARRHRRVAMPIYTHFQPALPGTYGHYLAGVATALERDLDGLLAAAADLGKCPLGAGAGGGTSVPIDPARTAELLGFERPVDHSLDAVASRDLVLRLLAAAATLGVTLSRLATDLLLWSAAELGFLELPDRLIGSSSMMPQKRNAFLLEQIQGRSAVPLGALVTAATAMHAKPFSNSVAVGTEAVAPLWPALEASAEAATLMRLMAAGARPRPRAMLRRAEEGHTGATELANRLVLEEGRAFRAAHHEVGRRVRRAIAEGRRLEEGDDALAPAAIAERTRFGGGPASETVGAHVAALQAARAERVERCRERRDAWRAAGRALDRAAAAWRADGGRS